jgi:hypothetical protein
LANCLEIPVWPCLLEGQRPPLLIPTRLFGVLGFGLRFRCGRRGGDALPEFETVMSPRCPCGATAC